MVRNVKLGKNLRSVSIVGVGATPFFNGVENPTYKGLTNGELFGHAALDAMAMDAAQVQQLKMMQQLTTLATLFPSILMQQQLTM